MTRLSLACPIIVGTAVAGAFLTLPIASACKCPGHFATKVACCAATRGMCTIRVRPLFCTRGNPQTKGLPSVVAVTNCYCDHTCSYAQLFRTCSINAPRRQSDRCRRHQIRDRVPCVDQLRKVRRRRHQVGHPRRSAQVAPWPSQCARPIAPPAHAILLRPDQNLAGSTQNQWNFRLRTRSCRDCSSRNIVSFEHSLAFAGLVKGLLQATAGGRAAHQVHCWCPIWPNGGNVLLHTKVLENMLTRGTSPPSSQSKSPCTPTIILPD